MFDLSRRYFLGALPLLPLSLSRAGQTSLEDALFFSAAGDSNGRHWLRVFQLDKQQVKPLLQHELPGRAHHVAVHRESGLYVAVARRPGSYLFGADLHHQDAFCLADAAPGRHFYGHGVFSEDGRFFYSTENVYGDLKGDSGRIGVWKVNPRGGLGLERVREFPSYGVGPHELGLMPGGKVLAVANGGIRTHPRQERKKLNLDTMQPSLVYLNVETGDLIDKVMLPAAFHQASIRHLDINQQGLVAFAMQYEGEPFDEVPLVALHEMGGELRLPVLPEQIRWQMKQYCGSVRFDTSGRYFSVSSPHGNLITFWDVEKGYAGSMASRNGCGICGVAEGGFLVSANNGKISYYDMASAAVIRYDTVPESLWDNHLTTMRV